MENKHRQTPWYVIPEENKEGFYIASTIDEDFEDVEICTVWDKWTNDQGKANAEFICRAVNNHYRLVEALREIKTLNSDYWLNHNMNTPQTGNGIGGLINQVTTIIEKAIANATE